MLSSSKQIHIEFKDLEIDFLEETEIILKDWIYHQGKASVIRFVVCKA